MVKRIMFITGPPRSGKSTLAGAIASERPDIGWLKTRDLCAPGPWQQLGAMYPDEEFLYENARRRLEASDKETMIIDGAPREWGQMRWAGGLKRGIVVLTNSDNSWSHIDDMGRSSRWFSVQVHAVAKSLEMTQHIIGPHSGFLTAEEVLTWWEGVR